MVLALGLVGSNLAGTMGSAAVTSRVHAAHAPILRAADLTAVGEQPPAAFTGPALVPGSEGTPDGSKRLWFAEGRWWAVLAGSPSGFTIWALEGPRGPWTNTGVLVDDRPYAEPSVIWTGEQLVVASSGPRNYRSHGLHTIRFRWSSLAGTWQQEDDFPVAVTIFGVPDAQLVVTPDGQAWFARLVGSSIQLAHTDPSGLQISPFAALPGGVAGSDVGGFDLASDSEHLRLVWRSVGADQLHEATLANGRWSVRVHAVYGIKGVGPIDAKPSGDATSAGLLVLVPTTIAHRTSSDQVSGVILVKLQGASARTSTVSRVLDGLRHPQLAVDQAAHQAIVVATVEPSTPQPGTLAQPGLLTEKTASTNDLAFGVGPGRTLLAGTGPTTFGAPMVPLQPVDQVRGLLVVAGTGGPTQHTIQVGGEAPGDQARAVDDLTLVHDTFDQVPLGTPPAAWYQQGGTRLRSSIVASGSTGRALRMDRPGGTTTTGRLCRAFPDVGPQKVQVSADVLSGGLGKTDVELLSVRGPSGTMASARLSRKGEIGWSGPNGRVAGGLVVPGTPLRVNILIDPVDARASIRIEAGSTIVAERADVPLLGPAGSSVVEVCLGPSHGPAQTSLELTDLLVQRLR